MACLGGLGGKPLGACWLDSHGPGGRANWSQLDSGLENPRFLGVGLTIPDMASRKGRTATQRPHCTFESVD